MSLASCREPNLSLDLGLRSADGSGGQGWVGPTRSERGGWMRGLSLAGATAHTSPQPHCREPGSIGSCVNSSAGAISGLLGAHHPCFITIRILELQGLLCRSTTFGAPS